MNGRIVRRCGFTYGMMLGLAFSPLMAQQSVATHDWPNVDLRASEVLTRKVTIDLDRVSLRQAIDVIAAGAGIRIQYRWPVVDAITTPVTLHVKQVTVETALDLVLRGTTLHAAPLASDLINITSLVTVRVPFGIITGHVIDARTQRPLRGATVSLDNEPRGGLTDEDGRFRILDVNSGSHRIRIRLLGYSKQAKDVNVVDGQIISLEVALQASANTLDQVVVTGTIIPTELKAVPNAITVITAKQIEQRGITHIDQLFHGDVPGLFALNEGSNSETLLDEVVMFSRGATALSSSSAGVSTLTNNTNPIKTYVDGVELADPKYLSQIDPKSIERIEILTGPQASTIYGSNAINGVMQIFTKRGITSTPQLTLNLLSGFVQSNFSNALTPQHDYGGQLSGIEGRLSYNAGGSWNYVGPWTPAKQTARTDGFGGARLELPAPLGRVTTDIIFRRGITQSRQRGDAEQSVTLYRETGWWSLNQNAPTGLAQPTTRTLTGQTLGLTLSYAPTSWWSHELGWGQDVSDTERRYTSRGYASLSDTALFLYQIHADRRSMRYATTTRIPMTLFVQAVITGGIDAWQRLSSSLLVQPQTLTGALTGSTNLTRQPDHNTGGFFQMQVGMVDRLFVTYGLRAEWNPSFGAAAQPNYAPRYGVAYTQDFGFMTTKFRTSYGRSTRPPQAQLKIAQTIADVYGADWPTLSSYFVPYYGRVFDYVFANPDLTPEHQQGGEGGLELYLGTHASLVITRYNQTVDGLIDQPIVDSVRSLVICRGFPCAANSFDANGYGYLSQYQYLNIGSIRNQGWELQGSLNTGPLTTKGTYSWTKSRVIGVNPRYRAQFANQPQYTPGATFKYLPEHTWAVGVTYARNSSNVGLNVTGTERVITDFGDAFSFYNLNSNIRLPQNRLRMNIPSGYVYSNAAYALADFMASHRVTQRIDGVLQVQNLTDHYTNDFYASYASLGRQVKLGVQVR